MKNINHNLKESIKKDKNLFQSLLQENNIPLDSNFKCLCSSEHSNNDKNPSMRYYNEGNFLNCFVYPEHKKDIFSFYAHIKNLDIKNDFLMIVEELAKLGEYKINNKKKINVTHKNCPKDKNYNFPENIYKNLKREYYKTDSKMQKRAVEYLKKKGISEKSNFEIIAVPDTNQYYTYYDDKGEEKNFSFKDCFIIPLTYQGKIYNLQKILFRSTENKFFLPKTTIKPNYCGNLNSKKIIITESYFKSYALLEKLEEIENNDYKIATCSSATWISEYIDDIDKEENEIFIFFDFEKDKYGKLKRDLFENVAKKLKKAKVKLVINDEYLSENRKKVDINNLITEFNFSGHDFLKLIENSIEYTKKHYKDSLYDENKITVIDSLEELFIYFVIENPIINIKESKLAESKLENYYVMLNNKRKLYNIQESYNSKKYRSFKAHIETYFLNRYRIEKINSKGEPIYEEIDFNNFYDKLIAYTYNNEPFLNIKDVQKHNLSTIKNNKLHLSTDIDAGVLITKDGENIYYTEQKPIENIEIEETFQKLFENNFTKLKAHIITSILNEDILNKHLLVLQGTSGIGKTKTAQLLSKIISNDTKTTSAKNLHKKWDKFFQKRSPILDNVDKKTNLEDDTIEDLNIILTSEKTNLDVRYSVSGQDFYCDIYPILSTVKETDDLFGKDNSPIKSRCINIKITNNDYAKQNIEKFILDNNFIEKARLHFYYLSEQYLIKKGNIDISTSENRNKGFFRVLTWLNKDEAYKFEEENIFTKEYSNITNLFIEMLESKTSLQNKELQSTQWCEELRIFVENKKDIDEINRKTIEKEHFNKSLFRNYLNKEAIKDSIGNFRIIFRKGREYNSYSFLPILNNIVNFEKAKEIINAKDSIEKVVDIFKGEIIEENSKKEFAF